MHVLDDPLMIPDLLQGVQHVLVDPVDVLIFQEEAGVDGEQVSCHLLFQVKRCDENQIPGSRLPSQVLQKLLFRSPGKKSGIHGPVLCLLPGLLLKSSKDSQMRMLKDVRQLLAASLFGQPLVEDKEGAVTPKVGELCEDAVPQLLKGLALHEL